jgi:hypothetical protein
MGSSFKYGGSPSIISITVIPSRLGDDPGSPEIDPDRSDYPRLIRIDPGSIQTLILVKVRAHSNMNYPIWRQSRRFLGGYLIYKLLIYRQSLNEFVTVMGIAISKACNRSILPKTEDVARRVKEEGACTRMYVGVSLKFPLPRDFG